MKMKDTIEITNVEEIDRSSWEKLKVALLEIQTEFEDRNGLDYCKNCGMNYKQLIVDIEKIFNP